MCEESYVSVECDAEDCTEADVIIFESDGIAVQYLARWSRTMESLRVVLGCPSVGDFRWSVTAEGLLEQEYDHTVRQLEATCRSSMLAHGPIAHLERASGGFEAALRSVPSSPECSVALDSP